MAMLFLFLGDSCEMCKPGFYGSGFGGTIYYS